jgi:N-acylneuraminate cytidylyltransferase
MALILVHIPARGGSKGIPGKNLRTVLGISLVGWAVLAARRLRVLLHDRAGFRILVDTDDDGIAAEGLAWGAEVPFLRPPELARDDTPTAACVVHALDRLGQMGWSAEAVVLLQPTSPLRVAEDVRACVEPYLHGTAESVVSIAALEHPLELAHRVDAAGILTPVLSLPGGAIRRQDGTRAFFPSGSVYVIGAALLRATGCFLQEGATRGVELPLSRSIDIDEEGDLARAEAQVRGEAMASGPGPSSPGALDGAAQWPVVQLDALPSGLAHLEELLGGDGSGGLLAMAPAAWGGVAILDGIAACRRAAGLPVAWPFDAARPEHAAAALAGGAAALVVRDAQPGGIAAAQRILGDWPGRRIVTT